MNTTLLLVAVPLGLLAAALSSWAADTLPRQWAAASPPAASQPLVSQLPTTGLPSATRNLRNRLVYAAMAAAFVLTAWFVEPDPLVVAAGWLYTLFLLTVVVIDLEHRRVLNIMLAPAAVVALALSFLPQTPPDPISALAGGAVGLGLFVLVFLLSRGHLGMGDVKLAGVIGLMLGYPAVVNALMVGILLGAGAALFLLATRRATRKSYMAYAPYMALGALVAIWWYW